MIRLVSFLRFPKRCRMSDECPIEKFLSELKIHERECKYRTVTCPNFECGAKVTFVGLLDHIKSGHLLVEEFNEFPIAKKIKLTFNKTNPQPKLVFGKVSLPIKLPINISIYIS